MTMLNPLAHISALTVAAASLSAALIAAVWQGLLLAIVVAVLLRLAPALSAKARSAVWMLTFALAMLLDFAPLLPAHGAGVVQSGRTMHIGLIWAIAVACVWLGCSLIRAAQLVVSAFHLRQLGRASNPVTDRLPAFAHGWPRGAEVCVSDAVDRPCVAGFFKPRILFPPALLASLSDIQLEHVLLHETEHLRRGDDWTNLVQKLALVIFPLNPVLLWIERRLCVERELACDDRVLDRTAARKAYAVCLTSLAEHTLLTRRLSRGFSLALGAWERRSELASRVYRILNLPEQTLSRPRATAWTGALIALLLAATGGLVQTPALVSFTPEAATTVAAATPLMMSAPNASSEPRMQLARAVMPPQAAVLQAAKFIAHRRPRRLHRAVLKQRAQPLPEVRFTTVAATQQEPVQDGSTVGNGVPRQPEFLPVVRYAAVRVPGGWLLFQL